MSTANRDLAQGEALKAQVREFWNAESCGERHFIGPDAAAAYDAEAEERYHLEPYILEFGRFHEGAGRDVLEIGVGMGADHLRWARSAPRSLCGVDLTARAIEFTSKRVEAAGLVSRLEVADAESLPFDDASFDIVYSWGVLHHSANTQAAVDEVWRVLRPGGKARIMVYHTASLTGFMLWARYALLAAKPLTGMASIYARYLESPGTKAYNLASAKQLMHKYASVQMRTELAPGDLLWGGAGARHEGPLLSIARAIWPRAVLRRYGRSLGLFLLIEATK